ncbi:MAG: efflux RND transporter periplasmic adaptor subunit [Luminiphilus sp.]|nr:efflux RND transporter periplasmic adaptor subunit [Luminiphilus sp.]
MSINPLRNTLVSLFIAAGIVIFGSAAIRANVAPTISTDAVPLPVTVQQYQLTDGYTVPTRFFGVVQASTDTLLGFEVAGLLAELNAMEGDYLQQGQQVGRLDTRQQEAALAVAKASQREAEAQLELALLTAERTQTLLDQQLTSKQALDDALLTAEALSARVATMRASVNNAQLVIDKSQLRVPFDAVVVSTLAEPGAVVGPAVPVLRLISIGDREVHIGVSPQLADRLTVNEFKTIRIDDQLVSARLRSLNDDIDPRTMTVKIVFTLPDDTTFRVGAVATLEMSSYVRESGGWLPLESLMEGDKGLWSILTVASSTEPSATRRESVEVVYTENDRAYVRGTLANNDWVVATGLQRLSPGTTVMPTLDEPPMAY